MTPAQNTTAYIQGFDDGKRTAKAEIERELAKQEQPIERNFCERCGKRAFDGIHTCTPPAKQEQREQDEFLLRGVLASELKCWHRLTADESQNLIDFVKNMGAKQELGEPSGHGGRPMTLRECMEAEEPKQGHSFTYAQMKEQVEGLQRDYDLLLAEYNLLKQEQGEPVALVTGVYGGRFTYAPFKESLILPVGMALYSSPQQCTWVGLTDEEVEEIWGEDLCVMYSGNIEATKAIEAKLKEKNT